MRILIVGSGGREHALAHHLGIKEGNEILGAPGNPGVDEIGTTVGIDSTDIKGLLKLVEERDIDLTVVGPEAPLVLGIVDQFRLRGFPVVGPTSAAARLEGSKAFSKAFMARHGIPTAIFRSFTRDQLEDALGFVDEMGAPVVVKASGLAAGKGAVVCDTVADATATVVSMLSGSAFGAATNEIVVEEFMDGEEASVFALCSGTDYVLLPTAQDHKRVGEGDTGLNTGGMGAYAPAPVVTDNLLTTVREAIIEPTLAGMQQEGAPYSGFLYVGLMISKEGGARVVEYNCRLGDPETQVILPLVESNLAELLYLSASDELAGATIRLSSKSAAVVVLASGGYPDNYAKGKSIGGLEDVTELADVTAYHAGTARANGSLVTAGGRVLGIAGVGVDLRTALEKAYAGVEKVSFDGMYFRRDIGRRGLDRN